MAPKYPASSDGASAPQHLTIAMDVSDDEAPIPLIYTLGSE